jgi:hypothetical protein
MVLFARSLRSSARSKKPSVTILVTLVTDPKTNILTPQ